MSSQGCRKVETSVRKQQGPGCPPAVLDERWTPEDKTEKPKEEKIWINFQHKYQTDDSILFYRYNGYEKREELMSVMLRQERSTFLCTFQLKQKAKAKVVCDLI